MAVYKLNEITKTLDKLFKYNVKTTEKVANLKWQDLDSIGDFLPFEKSLIMDLKVIIESNYKTNRRRIENKSTQFGLDTTCVPNDIPLQEQLSSAINLTAYGQKMINDSNIINMIPKNKDIRAV